MPLSILQATRCCVPEYNNIPSHKHLKFINIRHPHVCFHKNTVTLMFLHKTSLTCLSDCRTLTYNSSTPTIFTFWWALWSTSDSFLNVIILWSWPVDVAIKLQTPFLEDFFPRFPALPTFLTEILNCFCQSVQTNGGIVLSNKPLPVPFKSLHPDVSWSYHLFPWYRLFSYNTFIK